MKLLLLRKIQDNSAAAVLLTPALEKA